jgi:hypothetical protein
MTGIDFPQERLSYLRLGNWQFEDIVALTDMVAPSSTLKSLLIHTPLVSFFLLYHMIDMQPNKCRRAAETNANVQSQTFRAVTLLSQPDACTTQMGRYRKYQANDLEFLRPRDGRYRRVGKH